MEGYNVITAINGTEAIDKVYELTPDIISIDFYLAKSCKLCNLISSEYKEIHIIFHTTDTSYKDRCQLWSLDAFILKSSDLTGLKQKVNGLIEKTDETRVAIPGTYSESCKAKALPYGQADLSLQSSNLNG